MGAPIDKWLALAYGRDQIKKKYADGKDEVRDWSTFLLAWV
jgi:hypothetical protein